MKVRYKAILAGLLCMQTLVQAVVGASTADSLYFAKRQKLITAVWHRPFSFSDVHSNNAPKGPYMGNGDVGVTTYTSENSQTLRISKVDFVTDGWSDWAGSGPAALPIGGVTIEVNSPAFYKYISTNRPDSTGFLYEMDQYRSELRMRTGTAQQVSMRSWMGMNDNYVITELSTGSTLPVLVSVTTFADSQTPFYHTSASMNGKIAQVSRQTKTEGVRWISQAGISTKIVGTEPQCQQLSNYMIRMEFQLDKAHPVYVVSYVSGGDKQNDAQLDVARAKLSEIDREDVKRIESDKNNWWRDMWYRSYVDTHDEQLDRQYLTSIYLLASAYNTHSPVCGGMYGVWNMDDMMMYHGDIHLNYNSQAGFYSVFSANRPELSTPFYKTIDRLIPEGKRRAREEMGKVHPSLEGKSCRGLLFPVSALGIGEFYFHYIQQTADAPFCMPLYCWYYDYTGDRDFLKNKAYPYIRLIGDFYEDYLQKQAYGKSYRYCIQTGAHEGSWDLNPPSDLAFVELAFRSLLRYSKILGIDKERRSKWNDIVTHLPKYKVTTPTKTPNQGLPVYAKNEAGWDYPPHAIQLHGVYPCEVLNLRSDPESLQIARNTLYYYEVSQKGFTDCINELGLSAFVMGARMGFDAHLLIDNLKALIKTAGPNFLINDGNHCTEKAAVVETMNSMMLQSVDGILYLFPCWTESPASFTRLRAKGAFIVSAQYDGHHARQVSVTSEQGGLCRIYHPQSSGEVRITVDGHTTKARIKDHIFSFKTQKGKTYSIQEL